MPTPIRRFGAPAGRRDGRERVAGEEPLQLRLDLDDGSTPLVTTMRTPGADFELAAGFLLAEGIVRRRSDLLGLSYCRDVDDGERYNVVHVRLGPGAQVPAASTLHRFAATAACGVCGKGQLISLADRGCAPVVDGVRVSAALLATLPDRLRRHQPVFERTGGLHAAGLFTADGGLLAVREDVGRHNALDKLFGWAFLADVPLAGTMVCVSGRAGYELLQKCVVARVPVFAAVSAPSSLAVAVARGFGITLAAFVRDGRFNVYAHEERVLDDLAAMPVAAPAAALPPAAHASAAAANPAPTGRVD
ncbi:MAG: formate dehydrogenase accessory sulfurtransferase FdhD [bacterium]|nr:formate dehydrogenase accessory sulfurtransferase FdhD [bacterium]